MAKKIVTALATLARLGIADLETRLGVDRSTVARWIRSGEFPAPHYVGSKRAWFESEVLAWELRRMARASVERRVAKVAPGPKAR
jgi:predicted DNA-binding transcriptional regulator AlpA